MLLCDFIPMAPALASESLLHAVTSRLFLLPLEHCDMLAATIVDLDWDILIVTLALMQLGNDVPIASNGPTTI